MSYSLNIKVLHRYLRCNQSNAGFTLIELLVVFMIMAFLAAIAMPSFINQAAKARQSEAKQNLGLVNRAQTQYRTEKDRFADSFDLLAVGGGMSGGNKSDTKFYTYEILSNNLVGDAAIIAYPKDTADRSYSGGSSIYSNSAGLAAVASLICESKQPGVGVPPVVQVTGTGVDCPAGDYQQINDTVKGN
jgi:type IV pilus assembly protein PilA